jgi:hypothetical protein
MRHGRGKSDFAIVAVKLANKAERLPMSFDWRASDFNGAAVLVVHDHLGCWKCSAYDLGCH